MDRRDVTTRIVIPLRELGVAQWAAIVPVAAIAGLIMVAAALVPFVFYVEVAQYRRHVVDGVMFLGLAFGGAFVVALAAWLGVKTLRWLTMGEVRIEVDLGGVTTHRVGGSRRRDRVVREVWIRPILSSFFEDLSVVEAIFVDGQQSAVLAWGATARLSALATGAGPCPIRMGRPIDGGIAFRRLFSWAERPVAVPAPHAPSEPIPLTRDATGVTVELRPFSLRASHFALLVLCLLAGGVLATVSRRAFGIGAVAGIGLLIALWHGWRGRRGHRVRVARDAQRIWVDGPIGNVELGFDEIVSFAQTTVHVSRAHVAHALALVRGDDRWITIRTGLSRRDVAWVAAQLRAAMGIEAPAHAPAPAFPAAPVARDERFVVASDTVHPVSSREARPPADGELIERPSAGPDRVAVVEGGIQHVADGRETFVRFRDLYAVVEHEGCVYLLVPRTLPAPPWLVVHAGMLEDRSPGALARFAARARQGGDSGGFRDAVRRHRQGMSREALWRRVRAREALPGMMEVPPTQPRTDPMVARVQAAIVVLGSVLVLVPFMFTPLLVDRVGELAIPFMMLFGLAWPLAMIALAVAVGRLFRAMRDAKLPRRRVLVLAPDGCVVGARDGIRSLEWSHVSGFRAEAAGPTQELGLVVYGARGERLCDVEARYLAAPLGLVVAVAEAYRHAAR